MDVPTSGSTDARSLRASRAISQDSIRSVHMTSDSSMLAVGGEVASRGFARVYAVNDWHNQLKCTFSLEKVCWAVRLSDRHNLLCTAGFDCTLSVYDVKSYVKLQTIKLGSTSGPPFVWNLDFSQDSRCLALACWSGRVHVYSLKPGVLRWRRAVRLVVILLWKPYLRPTSMIRVLSESAVIERADRMYSVALSAHAEYVAVGGRDKMVAMYKIEDKPKDQPPEDESKNPTTPAAPPGRSERRLAPWPLRRPSAVPVPVPAKPRPSLIETNAPREGSNNQLMWEVASADFVYTVALSCDCIYCAHGGTSAVVSIVDGLTGRPMWSVPVSATIWCISILDDGAAAAQPKMVVSGDFAEVNVFDLATHKNDLRLRAPDDIAYSVTITNDSISYSQGGSTWVYGLGGTRYAWNDQPSFHHVSQLALGMVGADEDDVL
eukprot:7079024-Prymnesium_polylepis.1